MGSNEIYTVILAGLGALVGIIALVALVRLVRGRRRPKPPKEKKSKRQKKDRGTDPASGVDRAEAATPEPKSESATSRRTTLSEDGVSEGDETDDEHTENLSSTESLSSTENSSSTDSTTTAETEQNR